MNPVKRQVVHQNSAFITNDSTLCAKFTFGSHNSTRSVSFFTTAYAGIVDKKDYEGEYLFTGKPCHESGKCFTVVVDSSDTPQTEKKFKLSMKLNCDDVIIQ